MRISVLIPAYNEEDTIGETLEALMQLTGNLPAAIWEIAVIDDGSTDSTAEQAARFPVRVIKLGRNIGKGAALRRGLRDSAGDIVMFLDADLQESALEAHKLLGPLIEGQADMTIAVFPPPPRTAGLGLVKNLAAGAVCLFTGRKLQSPLCGQRALRRCALGSLTMMDDGYGVEVGMLIDLLRAGYRVIEVKTDMYHRFSGRDLAGFRHRARQFADILIAVRRRIKRQAAALYE